jgi:hypothetical protein
MNIVFCLPGKNFSNNFLRCWSETLTFCFKNKITPMLSMATNSNVYYVRSQCLGANVLRGINQKPFNDKVNYDYIMWIDSDIVFNPSQIIKLISHNKDIVCGLYKMDGGKQFAVVENWNEEVFSKNGTFKFLEDSDISGKTDLMEVEYSGMGFMLVKKGVFETINYPWFEPIFYEFGSEIRDFCSEDVGFCKKSLKAGYKIHIDPTVIVGHEKTKIY